MNFPANGFVKSLPSYDDDDVGLSGTSGWKPMPCAMSFLANYCKTQCWKVTTPHENVFPQATLLNTGKGIDRIDDFPAQNKSVLKAAWASLSDQMKIIRFISSILIPFALSS